MSKLEGKLVGWKEKALSQAGNMILVKAVASAMQSYVMQTFLLPKALCDRMDSVVRRFWWGFKDHSRHLYLKAWDAICSSKSTGGLSFTKFHDMNSAFITKLAWRLCT